MAYLPAVNVQLGEFYVDVIMRQLPFVVLVQFSSLFLVGAYSILWRYVSIEDLKVFLKAAVISAAILSAFRFLFIFTDFTSVAGARLGDLDRHRCSRSADFLASAYCDGSFTSLERRTRFVTGRPASKQKAGAARRSRANGRDAGQGT